MPDYVKRGLVVSGAFFLIAYLLQPSSFKVSNPPIVPIKETSVHNSYGVGEGVVAIEQHETDMYDPCGLKEVVCDNEKNSKPKNKLGGDNDTNKILKAIIMAESGGDPRKESETDVTADGYAFSIGLAQVNITYHRIDGLDCPSAFNGHNYSATVKNKKLYTQCVERAKDPVVGAQKAKEIYKSSGYGAWGAFLNGSYLRFM